MLEVENKFGFCLNKLIFNLNALVDLGEVATSKKDFEGCIKSALYLVMGTLSVSKGVIFQFYHHNNELKAVAAKGFDGLAKISLKLKKEEICELVNTNGILEIANTKGHAGKLFLREKVCLDKIKASILIPLVAKGELVGMIVLGKKFSGDEYSKEDYGIFYVMAHHIAFVIHNNFLTLKLASQVNENQELYEDLRLIYYDTIQAFATAIDAKDAYTKGHSSRVSKYCVAIAGEMGFSGKQIEGIRIAGLLHDIGKITVDKNIINKPGRLTKEEKFELDQHPIVSYEILTKIRFPWKDISINVRHHHEMMDGTGYPDQLVAKDIPEGSKILALADSFDAMMTDRPYRKKLSLDNTLVEINRTLGKQFDPKVFQHFLRVIKKDINGSEESIIKAEWKTIANIHKVRNIWK